MSTKITHCKDCRRHEADVGRLSRHHLCAACGLARSVRAINAMVAESGPEYEAWVHNGGTKGRPPGIHTPWRKGRRSKRPPTVDT